MLYNGMIRSYLNLQKPLLVAKFKDLKSDKSTRASYGWVVYVTVGIEIAVLIIVHGCINCKLLCNFGQSVAN